MLALQRCSSGGNPRQTKRIYIMGLFRKCEIQIIFHASTDTKVSVRRSEVAARVKYKKDGFKEYIKQWVNSCKNNPMDTDWVRIRDPNVLPPATLLRDLAERMSRLAAQAEEQQKMPSGKGKRSISVMSGFGGRDTRL